MTREVRKVTGRERKATRLTTYERIDKNRQRIMKTEFRLNRAKFAKNFGDLGKTNLRGKSNEVSVDKLMGLGRCTA